MQKHPPLLQLRKQPAQSRSRMTLDSLLEAAANVLKNEGYEAMTVERVTVECGVALGTFYEYFAHKDALLAELRRRHNAMIETTLVAALESSEGTTEQIVRNVVAANVDLHAVDPELHRALTVTYRDVGVDTDDPDAIEQLTAPSNDVFAAYLADQMGVPSSQATQMANIVFVLAESLTHAAIIEGYLNIHTDTLVDEITNVILGYFDRTMRKN